MTIKVGIDKIGLYVPAYYIEMTTLAQARRVKPDKFIIGIGQDKMAVPPLNQDVVSMAANAALSILDEEDRATIDQIIVGTESSFDYSKSVASFVHELLGIQPFCKAYEIKQACYGATAGIQSACDYVRLRPERKVLVIATDIARYGLKTGGEPTQGAGAVALLISANPRIMSLELESISYTTNQFDFWRPSYSDVALVDGKFSTELYQQAFVEVVSQYAQHYPQQLAQLSAMALHLPFTKMGKKALDALEVSQLLDAHQLASWREHYTASSLLGRAVGNIYTGSLYMSLLSLLMHDTSITAGQTIGLFSYGSGAVAELLVGELQAGFRDALDGQRVEAHLARRESLTIEAYEDLFVKRLPVVDDVFHVPGLGEPALARLVKIDQHRRYYTIDDK